MCVSFILCQIKDVFSVFNEDLNYAFKIIFQIIGCFGHCFAPQGSLRTYFSCTPDNGVNCVSPVVCLIVKHTCTNDGSISAHALKGMHMTN